MRCFDIKSSRLILICMNGGREETDLCVLRSDSESERNLCSINVWIKQFFQYIIFFDLDVFPNTEKKFPFR